MINKPKIFIFDIETAPNLAYVWGKYQQDVIDYKNEWYMLSFSGKWLGESKIYTYGLIDFPLYKKDKYNDLELVKKLWGFLNEADIVITHNGNSFDIPKANARFIYHNLMPPNPFQSIDTKYIAKKYFNFNSNSLNDLGRYLKIGQKVKTGGFDLWLGCMNGNKKFWKTMLKYNKNDVILLEKLYLRLRAWITNHPNIGLYERKEIACPNCGSIKVYKSGLRATKIYVYQRYRCNDCGAWSQARTSEKNITKPLLKN